jgi:hypothetical protein
MKMKNLGRTCAAMAILTVTANAHAGTPSLPRDPSQTEVAPLRRSATAGPTIYISDYSHLAEVTKEDDLISGMARRLASRRTLAYSLQFGAVGSATLAMLLLMKDSGNSCATESCSKSSSNLIIYSTLVVSAAAALAGIVVQPRSRDLYDVVNAWNERHVDRQLGVTTVPSRDGSF